MARYLLIILFFMLGSFGCSNRPRTQHSRYNTNNIARTDNNAKSSNQRSTTLEKPTEVDNTANVGSNSSHGKYSGEEIYDKYNNAVFMVYTSDNRNSWQGSGFFVSASGRAVSNYHVFEGTIMGYEELHLADGRVLKISKVVAKSKAKDYIVFDVTSNKPFTYIPVNTHQNKVGEQVYAIGSPQGLDNTFSQGQISQIRPNEDYTLQINVPIDHGSSGGALINSYGEVIGITSAGLDSQANLNFAVDINEIKQYLR